MTSFKDNNITDVEMSLKIRLFIVTQQVTALGCELLRGAWETGGNRQIQDLRR